MVGSVTCTVLVVEDDPLVRLCAVYMLEELGYCVPHASNADEAISILKARTDIHIVFTDIDMPGSMDGLKLAAFIRDRWPPIKIVVTSGRAPVGDADLLNGGLFFAKPYRASEVANAFRELLAA